MSEKTEIWDRLGKTDPAHTKKFKRSGGFQGTAIRPMFAYRRMTEEFGPCGKGWGIGAPQFMVQDAAGERLVFCTVEVWYETREQTVPGVGGDKVEARFSSGPRADDEAYKKAFTDAVTNALKMIGVAADVHMGLFDDNKYVNAMRDEFSAPRAEAPPANDAPPHDGFPGDMPDPNPRSKSSAQLKRDDAWGKAMSDLNKDLLDCHTLLGLSKLKDHYRERARAEGWNRTFLEQLKEIFETAEQDIGAEEAEAA